MNTMHSFIKVETRVKSPIQEVWRLWIDPMHIIKWNAASDDWQTSFAENDPIVDGLFLFRMEAKDGSVGFDFTGTYTHIVEASRIEYVMPDGRKVKVLFTADKGSTVVTEEFEPETVHAHNLQKAGWQSILDNFKRHAEGKGKNEVLRFSVNIHASAQTVYQRMLDQKYYREWTKVFNPESHYVGIWEKRSMLRFIGVDGKGHKGGMVSRVRENIPGKFVSIEHLGLLKGEKEILSGSEVDSWAGSLENYKFTSDGTKTILDVYLDSNQEFSSYFLETWPKALDRLKEICEKV
ncbi:MAG: SRPBCC domain-containing protein [Oligoflexales bacterium]|nr:SRPBCC domain-containing protein [Oligoflexales bacterium]